MQNNLLFFDVAQIMLRTKKFTQKYLCYKIILMKRLIALLPLTFLMAQPSVGQDVYTGIEAYQKGDYEEALKHFIPLSNIDLDYTDLRISENNPEINALSQYYLGLMYCLGKGVQQNHVKATNWFRKAARQGNSDAEHAKCP